MSGHLCSIRTESGVVQLSCKSLRFCYLSAEGGRFIFLLIISVLDHGEGVCADPGKGDATLGVGGPGPPERDSKHQLIPDRGGGKT